MKTWVIFDWEDTLMRHFPQYHGPMSTWPKVEEMAGARKALHALHGKVGLGMMAQDPGCPDDGIRKVLEKVGLASFIKMIFCEKNSGIKKGTPEFYRYILTTLRVDPQHVVIIGDDFRSDVAVPRQLGFRAVWFNSRDSDTHAGESYTTVHKLEAVVGVLMGWGLLPRP